jgi:hypothetical protein
MLTKLTNQQQRESPPLASLEDVTDNLPLGIPRHFVESLTREMRGLRIYKHKIGNHFGFYCGYASDLFAAGRLWYGDPTDSGPAVKRYCLYSPRIVNRKYQKDSDRYYMVTARDEKAALSHAKKFLRRWTPEENALRLVSRADAVVTRHYGELVREIKREMNDLLADTTFHPQYVQELVALANSSYQFVDAEFGVRLRDLLKQKQELAIMEQKNNERWWVVYSNKNDAGQTLVVRVPINVKGAPSEWGRSFDLDGNAIVCSPEYLPEDVQGRMAVLQMVEYEHYVEGVGVRIEENCFYVVLNG